MIEEMQISYLLTLYGSFDGAHTKRRIILRRKQNVELQTSIIIQRPQPQNVHNHKTLKNKTHEAIWKQSDT
jgi:hypothetical protein